MKVTTIKIEGMHCDGCAQRLNRVLEREPGVARADVSLQAGERRTSPSTSRQRPTDRLRQAIQRAGYEAAVAA